MDLEDKLVSASNLSLACTKAVGSKLSLAISLLKITLS